MFTQVNRRDVRIGRGFRPRAIANEPLSIAGRNALGPMTLAPHKKLRERKDAAQGVTPSLSVYSSVNATRPAETVQGNVLHEGGFA